MAERALARDFPAQVLAIELQIHLSLRFLVAREGFVSEPLTPTRSIVAGVRGSNDLSRALLHPLLDGIHNTFTHVPVYSWVDDIKQRTEGPPRVVHARLVQAG